MADILHFDGTTGMEDLEEKSHRNNFYFSNVWQIVILFSQTARHESVPAIDKSP